MRLRLTRQTVTAKGMLVFVLLITSCRSSASPDEVSVSNQPASAPDSPVQAEQAQSGAAAKIPLSNFTQEQLGSLLEKEFDGLFRIDTQNLDSSHLIGDFNGDHVEDLAVIAKLNREINERDLTKPPFYLYAPLGAGMDARKYEAQQRLTLGDLARYKGDLLLIILQGVGESPSGISSKANFVLLEMIDRDAKSIKLYRGKLQQAIAGDEPKPVPPPRLQGDAISIVNQKGEGVAVYWDGFRYRWYPVDKPTR